MSQPDPKVAKRYDVYLPLRYNDGTEIEIEKYEQVEDELLDQFGGVTSVRRENPLKGLWKSEERIYYDEIVIFTVIEPVSVIDFAFDISSEHFRKLKEK